LGDLRLEHTLRQSDGSGDRERAAFTHLESGTNYGRRQHVVSESFSKLRRVLFPAVSDRF
jgi:hypothetical protein